MSERRDDKPATVPPESDVLTPRGGFMARPGLKQPPRHAVVIRLGDAPVEPEIPLARSSVPPPPPDSEPVIPLSEKITERAIRTPKPGAAASSAPSSALTTPLAESAPPPSDSPLVASVPPPPPSRAPESVQQRSRSRWTIVLAAAAGTVLGLLSVATTRRPPARANAEGVSESRVVAAARPVAVAPPASTQAQKQPSNASIPQDTATPPQAASQSPIAPHTPVVWPPPAKDKRSIF